MTVRIMLLATDFSQPAKVAACQATLLAHHFKAELKVLHVLPFPLAVPGAPDYGARLGEWFTGRAEQDISELETFFAKELSATEVDYVVLEGDPANRIVEYAHNNRVDLIVMPAHGQGPFRRFLLGSVTAKVLHDVECPVWTGIHSEELEMSKALRIDNIVCAVGLDPENISLIGWASEAARSFGARLFLVHVIPRAESAEAPSVPTEWTDAAMLKARDSVRELARQSGAGAEVLVTSGEIATEICRQVAELSADLLIIGRSPQSAMFGRLPTTAYAIIRDSRCPVVSV